MIAFIQILAYWVIKLPIFLAYEMYDHLTYWFYHKRRLFYGWGIHLYTGKFGQGKTSLMIMKAYDLCRKYPQPSIVTNLKIMNFPEHTHILPLNTAQDILNAPENCLVLIDEIGTIFNSRDFSGGKNSVPKSLFQHLCQCRKRKLMILATVQRFNLLDKQIRDITATVTACQSVFKHPFSRALIAKVYDIEEYEAYQANRMYTPVCSCGYLRIQTDKSRTLYDTSELITNMLTKEYISDKEILENRGEASESFVPLDKKQQRTIHKRPLF